MIDGILRDRFISSSLILENPVRHAHVGQGFPAWISSIGPLRIAGATIDERDNAHAVRFGGNDKWPLSACHCFDRAGMPLIKERMFPPPRD